MVTPSLAVERSHLLCVGALARIEVDSGSEGPLDIEGTITAAKSPMMITTTMISIRVKPRAYRRPGPLLTCERM